MIFTETHIYIREKFIYVWTPLKFVILLITLLYYEICRITSLFIQNAINTYVLKIFIFNAFILFLF